MVIVSVLQRLIHKFKIVSIKSRQIVLRMWWYESEIPVEVKIPHVVKICFSTNGTLF